MAVAQSAAGMFFEHIPRTVGKMFPEHNEPDLRTITAVAAAVTAVNSAARRCGYRCGANIVCERGTGQAPHQPASAPIQVDNVATISLMTSPSFLPERASTWKE